MIYGSFMISKRSAMACILALLMMSLRLKRVFLARNLPHNYSIYTTTAYSDGRVALATRTGRRRTKNQNLSFYRRSSTTTHHRTATTAHNYGRRAAQQRLRFEPLQAVGGRETRERGGGLSRGLMTTMAHATTTVNAVHCGRQTTTATTTTATSS